MNLHKKHFILLIIGTLLSNRVSSQNNGCIDSVSLNQFYPSYFEVPTTTGADFFFIPQRDTLDNLYISGGTAFPGFNNNYWSIIKFDTHNKLVWYKNYKTDLFATFRGGGYLQNIDAKANLLFYGISQSPSNPLAKWNTISKTDSAGSFLWSRTIKNAVNPDVSGYLTYPSITDNGHVYLTGRYFDYQEEPVVVAFDDNGILKWTKRYTHVTVPKYHFLASAITAQNDNTIILAVQYFYNADGITDPNAKIGFQLIKINTADGSIDQQKSIMYFDDVAGNIPRISSLQKIRYSKATKQFLLHSVFGGGNSHCIFTLVDENLNNVQTKLFISSSIPGLTKVSISNANEISITKDVQGPTDQGFHYTIIDNRLNLTGQKYVNLTSLGMPHRNFVVDLSVKKNGMTSFQIGTIGSSLQDYFYIHDQSPYYKNENACGSKDSSRYSESTIYTNTVVNPLIEESGTVALTITNNFPDFPAVEFPFPKTLLCKQTSVCDTIKLLGTKYHCLSNPMDSFKIYKNPFCVRKTNWQVDTSYIKILSQNDTVLYVQYKQAYRGKVRVSFGGCSLKDSLDIEVYNAQSAINLGNDTMHCPGKTITLKAGKNYKTYQWQDGSSRDSLVAAQPGLYHVTATDSCGIIFKDSITIKPFDAFIKTDYGGRLCPGDTVTFKLPDSLYNYSWLPVTNSNLNGFTWRLFPPVTSTYRITGERLPGCTVSDTVLINVRPNCLPDYIYFPTAFSPDGNGANDTYKPGFNGQLVLYELIIFNRYGQPVFKTTDPTKGWDGRFKNSSKPQTGSYVWTCKYQFAGRMAEQEQGSFVLVR